MNPDHSLLLPILVPAVAGAICLLLSRSPRLSGGVLVAAMVANLAAVVAIFKEPLEPLTFSLGLDLALRFQLDDLASFITLGAAVLGLLIALYTAKVMSERKGGAVFDALFLLTVAMANGAVLADHLVTLLVFWEAMMLSLYAMISMGHPGAYKTAFKAFFISGVTDLCLMAGAGLVWYSAGTLVMSGVHLDADGLNGLAFVLLAVGAMSKAGAMPFHSWIPDAALDAPLPFMALLPGCLEKLLGIYLLARVSLYMFTLGHGWASTLLMAVGAVTIVLAVLMALIQKDYKRLLSFHAISQVGYMILGIGTGTAVGIVGGLFHMVNNAVYKSALFLTGGAVERQAGTTDLRKLGGLAARMPITSACFAVAALSISGVYPFNGFFSKELVYGAALHRHWLFYAAAAGGSFLTAASFLKLGLAAYKGAYQAPAAEVKEAPPSILAPMIGLAGLCVLLGLANEWAILRLVVPSVPERFHEGMAHLHTGLIPGSWILAGATVAVQAAAVLNHVLGRRRYGSHLGAVDHIHHAPVARQLYDAAERRWFDPYELALKLLHVVAVVGNAVDRAVDFFYDRLVTWLARGAAALVAEAHAGTHAGYLGWSVIGAALVVFYLFVGGL
jgi:NADH-quinone oxidoreductase subunit L